jgi:general secretion pathway protein C
MIKRSAFWVHLAGAAILSAVAAAWALRLLAPAPAPVPAERGAAVRREIDPQLAARMFGEGAEAATLPNVQLYGVFAAGADSAAVLGVDGAPGRAVRQGQELTPGVRLAQVLPDGVRLDQSGRLVSVAAPRLPVATPAPPATPAARTGQVLGAGPARPAASSLPPVAASGAPAPAFGSGAAPAPVGAPPGPGRNPLFPAAPGAPQATAPAGR